MIDRDWQISQEIAEKVARAGGRAYFVGGYVRDFLRKQENLDYDMEVHGISPEVLEGILDSLGERMTMGESFGIYALRGYHVDIAMPRMEEAIGRGHRDFRMIVDPDLGVAKAAARRDFTVNAIMMDVLTQEIIDPYNGQEDMKRGILRHVDDRHFPEDPLRVLRGAQFAARFGYQVALETVKLCSTMDLTELAKERIWMELQKALLKSENPGVFFQVLLEMDQLKAWFPEVEQLKGITQDPIFHQEGDVWNHTMLVLREAAKVREEAEDPFGFMLAALCHDFGKICCRQEKEGRIHAYGHETEGLPLVETFLRRLTNEKERARYVLNLVEHHMRPNAMAGAGSSIKSTNRMFDESVDPVALIYLAVADSKGMAPPAGDQAKEFLFQRLSVFQEYMARPYVTGKDLMGSGVPAGKELGEVLAYCHKLRLAGIPKKDALKQGLAMARKMKIM